MASTSTRPAPSTAFSSSSSSTQSPKQVFLSFRGDTRCGFTDAVYHALLDRGLMVFRDKEDLPFGERINPALVEAIQISQCAVIVISPEFATSKACLFELTVIMKYRRMGHFTVFPIFYHVSPGKLERLMEDIENNFTKARDDPAAAAEKLARWKSVLEEKDLPASCERALKEEIKNLENTLTKAQDDPVAAAAAAKKLEYWRSVLEEDDLRASCKRALKEVSDLRAPVVEEDSYETKEVKDFSLTIFGELRKNSKSFRKPLVGISPRVDTIMKLINIEEVDDPRVIGICGISGIGKSTLAWEIYNKISREFTHCCFIEKIGKDDGNGYLRTLQEQLIRRFLGTDATKDLVTADQVRGVLENNLRRIRGLIVLDDVWDRSQVNALAESLDWFGGGSRIIITSQKSDLPHLNKKNVYEVKELNENDALELLCQIAFNQPQPKEGFERVAREIVECTRCLPFALVAFGTDLSRHQLDRYYWESYQKLVSEERENILFITLTRVLDDLTRENPRLKELFLDIACYFNNFLKNEISHILEAFGYNLKVHLGVLEEHFLLKISKDGRLLMHDLYVDVGKQIAKNSGLFCQEDVIRVLDATTVRPDAYHEIQGIVRQLSFEKREQFNLDALSAMTNLRILRIGSYLSPSFSYDYEDFYIENLYMSDDSLIDDCVDNQVVEWDGPLPKLGSELRIMEWHRCPFKTLDLDLKFTQLVVLKLRRSCIKQLCIKQMNFPILTVIDMGYSEGLISTPNFSWLPNLEILDLSGCKNLVSICGHLKRIKRLCLRHCCGLEHLSVEISSDFLEILDLFKCSKLTKFPNVLGELSYLSILLISGTRIKELPFKSKSFPSLMEFWANGTDIQELPSSIVSAGELNVLHIKCYNSNTFKLPPSFSTLSSLGHLALTNCIQSNEAIPIGLGDLSSLFYLDLSSNKITKILDCVSKLTNLKHLNLSYCTELELSEFRFENLTSMEILNLSQCNLSTIDESIGSLSFSVLFLDLSNNSFTELPDSICKLYKLDQLRLRECTSLRVLPKLPVKLAFLDIIGCPLSEAFDRQRTEQIPPELLQTKFCSSTVAYVGFDCKPHKILYLEREEFENDKCIGPMVVACCPMLKPRTPHEFTRGDIISSKNIKVRMDWEWEGHGGLGPETCVLSFVYEVTGESSDPGACEGSNPDMGVLENNSRILPGFVCQLQLEEKSADQIPELARQSRPVSVVVRVPEVAAVGSSYGVWVDMEIPDSVRRPKQEKSSKHKKRKVLDSSEEPEPIIRWSLVASVIATNENVKLKECGGHLFRGEDCEVASEFSDSSGESGQLESFYEVASEFSRPGLDLESLYPALTSSMEVCGRIE